MKNKKFITLFFIPLFFIAHQAFSQKNFERGYIIDDSGIKKDCLIKNIYRIDNPTIIEYKLIGSTEVKTASVAEITEFGIADTLKYIRAIVEIDKNNDGLNDIIQGEKKLEKDTIFINQLLEGKANLYKYSSGSLVRYFFNVDNDSIKQLVYKRYLEDNKEKKDLSYIKQLTEKVNCEKLNFDRIQNVKYTTKSLLDYFIDYNKCQEAEYDNFYSKVEKRNLVNMYVRGGINISNTSFQWNYIDYAKSNGIGLKLGAEVEIIVPISKKDIFSIFGEISYYQFKSKAKDDSGSFLNNYTFTHKNLEVAIGLRTYLLNSKYSSLFIDYSLGLNNEIQSELVTERYSELYPFSYSSIFGIGFKHKKIIIQSKYYTKMVDTIDQIVDQRVTGLFFTVGYQFK